CASSSGPLKWARAYFKMDYFNGARSNAMLPMGGAFALGCALSAAFLGGRAAADGSLGNVAKSYTLAFSVGGGIAVLAIAFFSFQYFKPETCGLPLISISDLRLLDPNNLEVVESKRTFRSMKELNTTAPIIVQDANAFRIPVLGVVRHYRRGMDGVVSLSIRYEVWEDNRMVATDKVQPLIGTEAWASRDLVRNSGGPEKIREMIRESGMHLEPDAIPVIFLLGCWGEASAQTHYYSVRLIVGDGSSDDSKDDDVSLHFTSPPTSSCGTA
ncbi:hypothetical protein ACC779_37170, partial [Rhizobium ruizarguesonis]